MAEWEQLLPADQDYGAITRQVTGITFTPVLHRRWLIALGASLALVALFVLSVAVLLLRGVGVWGINIPVNWGMAILNTVWWVGIGHAGTFISAMLLLLQQPWRNSLNRYAEAMTIFAVICASLYPILHLGRPWLFYWMFPLPGSLAVWPQFRSPLEWDVIAFLTYLVLSLTLFYVGLLPDLASLRDSARSRLGRRFYGGLSLGWHGSAHHWLRWRQIYVLAALALPLVAMVHSGVAMLFAAGPIPGWHSTLFPPYFVLGAVFSGFAVVSVLTVVLRRGFGLGNLLTRRHLDYLGQFLLGTGFLLAYCYLTEVFTVFYSGKLSEAHTLHDRLVGTYAWAWWGTLLLNLGPLQLLWLRRLRRSDWALLLVGLSAAVGMWLERFMLLVTPLYKDWLPSSWHAYVPSLWEWTLFAGTLGLFLMLFLLFLRLAPVVSIAEVKEVIHEQRHG